MHGLWLQCRRGHSLPHHRIPQRTFDCHPHELLRSLQWAFSNADSSFGLLLRRGESCCRRRLRVPSDCACRQYYAAGFLSAEQNHTARCAVCLCSGAAAVSPPEAFGCDCPQYAGQNDFCTRESGDGCYPCRRSHLALSEYHGEWAYAPVRHGSPLAPLGALMGLSGVILMAFLLGIPANEIVIPILLMVYSQSGTLVEAEGIAQAGAILAANGWTWVTAVCVILFSLNHFPCATTLLTIRKETGSLLWTGVSFLLPTVVGMLLCIAVHLLALLVGIFF